jgi:hypothetical protein
MKKNIPVNEESHAEFKRRAKEKEMTFTGFLNFLMSKVK